MIFKKFKIESLIKLLVFKQISLESTFIVIFGEISNFVACLNVS